MAFLGTKFTYNGKSSLEDFNLLICTFNDSASSSTESKLSMTPIYGETISSAYRKDYGAKYGEVLTPSCSVIRQDGSPFENDEIRQILRWLTGNRKLAWLTVYGYEENVSHNILCRVTRVSEQKIGETTVGFTIEWTANSPYSFSDIIRVSSEISGETTLEINNDGDELFDYVYPHITFENRGTSLNITNISENRTFELNNISSGESITVDNLNQIILVEGAYRTLGSDFNKTWVRLLPGENEIKVTGTGTITFEYRVPLKAGGF